VEKTYSNNNRDKAPEVLRPMEISSLFYLQNVLLFHNIHRSFTYFIKVTPLHLPAMNCNTIHKRSPSPYIPAKNYNTMQNKSPPPSPIYQLRTAIHCTRILRQNALVGSNWATCWDFSLINSFPTSSAAYQTPIQWITDGTIAKEYSGQNVKLSTHFHLLKTWRMQAFLLLLFHRDSFTFI